jgi:hypothetical protein
MINKFIKYKNDTINSTHKQYLKYSAGWRGRNALFKKESKANHSTPKSFFKRKTMCS